ncbi:hypothetical protein GJ496_008100 [Pomphorhynchus laevis]|nr:hypothetical protein GJ496_008100 [Pomphorhynchus laevis]
MENTMIIEKRKCYIWDTICRGIITEQFVKHGNNNEMVHDITNNYPRVSPSGLHSFDCDDDLLNEFSDTCSSPSNREFQPEVGSGFCGRNCYQCNSSCCGNGGCCFNDCCGGHGISSGGCCKCHCNILNCSCSNDCSKVYRQVIHVGPPPPRNVICRYRLPTPNPDVLDRTYCMQPQQRIIHNIFEKPFKPPMVIRTRQVMGPQPPDEVVNHCQRVPPSCRHQCCSSPSPSCCPNCGQQGGHCNCYCCAPNGFDGQCMSSQCSPCGDCFSSCAQQPCHHSSYSPINCGYGSPSCSIPFPCIPTC